MDVTDPTTTPAAVIPAVDTPSSTATVRSLGRRNVHTIAVADTERRPSCRSRYCAEVVTAPGPTRDLAAYEEALLELAQRRDVRTVFPFCEADVYVLARNRRTLAEHVGTPWPSLDTLRNVQDRRRLFAAATAAGVATPETNSLDEWDDWDRDVVVKPRYTVHATEYSPHFAETRTQWSTTRYVPPGTEPDRDELVAEIGHVPLVQEYVHGADEYGFFALYDDGDPVATFQHRQRRGWKYCGGPSAYREAVKVPELETAGRRLLDELEWHGVAMVEFLRNPTTGAFELMEVNPRFWSSLPFTVQAGVDFPWLYWRQATGAPVEPPAEYAVGAAGHLLRGELLHLHSILTEDYPLVDRPSFVRTLFDVADSIVRHPRFDYFDTDDIGPFVCDLRSTVARLRSERATARSDGQTPEAEADGSLWKEADVGVRDDQSRPPETALPRK